MRARAWGALVAVAALGCGGDREQGGEIDASTTADSGAAVDAAIDAPAAALGRCGDPVPDGAVRAAPPPIYAGTCPTLVPGPNTLASGGADREFILIAPTAIEPGETLPVFFMWHWLGGDADGFVDKGELQLAADQVRFIAAVPEAKGDLQFRWPIAAPVPEARVDEEVGFFDDMLACIAEQFEIDGDCVSTVGVSAGALWSAQLAPRRSDRIANFISLSGGASEPGDFLNPVKPWVAFAQRKMPGLVLWGGPLDFCGINFDTLSTNLEQHMETDGHFLVECEHNCAHAQPPTNPPEGTSAFDGFWRFALDHPYWIPEGASLWQDNGLDPAMPEWCAIGAGNATPRTGDCESGPAGECF